MKLDSNQCPKCKKRFKKALFTKKGLCFHCDLDNWIKEYKPEGHYTEPGK